MRREENPQNRHGDSSHSGKEKRVQTYLAADLRLVGAAVVPHERGGAENEKGEDPVDRADERGSDSPRRKRLDTEAADHGRISKDEDRLAGYGEHSRDGQTEDLSQMRGRRIALANRRFRFHGVVNYSQ